MENFIIIVLIVVGILQIMLFFKIWGMANNTKRIKDCISDKKRLSYHILTGDSEKIKQFLDEQICIELSSAYEEFHFGASTSSSQYTETYQRYIKLYERLNLDFPEHLKSYKKPSSIFNKIYKE